jgi:hypothetical protein
VKVLVGGPSRFSILTLGLPASNGISNPEGPTTKTFSYANMFGTFEAPWKNRSHWFSCFLFLLKFTPQNPNVELVFKSITSSGFITDYENELTDLPTIVILYRVKP